MTSTIVRSGQRLGLAVATLLIATVARAQQPAQAPAPAPAQAPAPAPAAQGTLRFAYIDSRAVLANTPGRPEAESLFAREMVGFRAEVQRLQAALDSSMADYNRARAAMTPQAAAQREAQLRQMDAQTRQRAQELDQQAQAREQELTAPIMQRVTAIIEGVRAEFNYAFVFDVSAQGNPIVAADRSLDITQMVIQRLQAAGAPPAPAAGTGAVQPAGQPPLGPARDTTRPAGPVLRPRPSRP